MVYRWRPGFQHRGVKAASAAAAITALRVKMGGGLTPADVVDVAASRKSPLHRLFTWDDTEAARQFRLQQARSVLNCIVSIEPGETEPVPMNTNVRVGKRLTYLDTRDAVRDDEIRERILDDALTALRSWHLRYATYREVSGLANDVKLVLERHATRKQKVA